MNRNNERGKNSSNRKFENEYGIIFRSHDDGNGGKILYLRIVLIKIYRESTSFAETFLICITHLSELCADAKGKVERFSLFFA